MNGATGAIGFVAVQLLKHGGVHVTAVCGTPQLALVQSLGADRVIDYLAADFTKEDARYDFVLDAVGKSTFGACKPILEPRGVYLCPSWDRARRTCTSADHAATRGEARTVSAAGGYQEQPPLDWRARGKG